MSKIDKNTLELLKDGNHDAFDNIFIAYYSKIKNFINGLLKSETDAEELIQDIFVKLWINRESVDPDKSFNAYLYTMAKNAVFNFLKHKYVHDAYINDFPSYNAADSSDEIIFAKEIALLIDMAVEKMPAQRKRIYQLSRNQGLTNEEIARQLNITKKTVENQLSLALKELRNIVSSFLAIFL